MSEKEKLILENEKLIYFVLKKNKLYHLTDELYDVGMIGLCKAANNFDKTKGYKFSTYAYTFIKNQILMEIRDSNSSRRKANFNTVSLDKRINNTEYDITLAEVIKDDRINFEEEIEKKEQVQNILKAICYLTKEEKIVIEHTFGLNGYKAIPQQDIMKLLGINQSNVSRLKTRAIKKIRKRLGI